VIITCGIAMGAIANAGAGRPGVLATSVATFDRSVATTGPVHSHASRPLRRGCELLLLRTGRRRPVTTGEGVGWPRRSGEAEIGQGRPLKETDVRRGSVLGARGVTLPLGSRDEGHRQDVRPQRTLPWEMCDGEGFTAEFAGTAEFRGKGP